MNKIIKELSEKECFSQLLEYKWKDGYQCKYCGERNFWSKPERRIIICRNCRKEISPLAGTMFSRSHISLEKWLRLVEMVCCSPNRVITARGMFEELELGSYRTAWEAMNKIRYAISRNKIKDKLNGTVELDEIVITGLGSEYRKISILGALEIDGKKRLSLQMVRNPDEMNIKHYFRKQFSKNVRVITAPEKLYIRNWLKLNRIEQVSSTEYYNSNFLNLHIVLEDVRYGLKNGHHSVSDKYLQANLDEYAFIFNHNEDRSKAFDIVLDYMVNTKIKDYHKSGKPRKSFLSIL